MQVMICTITHLATNYINALAKLGISSYVTSSLTNAASFDGLLIPGGGDIAPILFGQYNTGAKNISIEEDILQIEAFHYFKNTQKPILGICKGMQIINVALGGNMIQNLETHKNHEYIDKDKYHITKALSGSILHKLYGEYFTTNSAHHQGIDKIADNLYIAQNTSDGVIEGIEHKSSPIIGVQWHPERMLNANHSTEYASGLPIFQYYRYLLTNSFS